MLQSVPDRSVLLLYASQSTHRKRRSLQAMEAMAEKNHGEITCPKTGFKCDFSDLSKAYIS